MWLNMQSRPSNQLNQSDELNESNQIDRLVLGTAQLGMNYGIANRTGQPDFNTAESIVRMAWESGIREFDTAQAYGESEKILAHCLSRLGITNEVSIISKTHPSIDHLDSTKMQMGVKTSLSNFNRNYLNGYLLHKEELLDQWDKGLGELLVNLVEKEGLVKNIGVSVYSPERAIQALKTDHVSIVQLPSNILDRRFENVDVFELADRLQKTVYVRSVFLQGLIVMGLEDIPLRMQFATPVLKKLETFAQEIGISKHALALEFAKQAYPNAKIVIGVETCEQLKSSVDKWQRKLSANIVKQAQKIFKCVDELILNPSSWPD